MLLVNPLKNSKTNTWIELEQIESYIGVQVGAFSSCPIILQGRRWGTICLFSLYYDINMCIVLWFYWLYVFISDDDLEDSQRGVIIVMTCQYIVIICDVRLCLVSGYDVHYSHSVWHEMIVIFWHICMINNEMLIQNYEVPRGYQNYDAHQHQIMVRMWGKL